MEAEAARRGLLAGSLESSGSAFFPQFPFFPMSVDGRKATEAVIGLPAWVERVENGERRSALVRWF